MGEPGTHRPNVPSGQSAGSLFLILCFVLPGAGFTVFSSDFALSLKHPLNQADCDGSAPYWPGAAQLEAGDS